MTTTTNSQITCWVDGPQFHLVEDTCGRFWHVSDTPRRNEPMPGIRIKPEFAERLKGLDAEGGCPDWYPAWIDLLKEGDGQYAVFTWDLVACRVEFVANVSRWEFLRLSGYPRDPAPKPAPDPIAICLAIASVIGLLNVIIFWLFKPPPERLQGTIVNAAITVTLMATFWLHVWDKSRIETRLKELSILWRP